MTFKILSIDDNWKTVNYPEKSVGSARISKFRYEEELYLMEGVDGYELFCLSSPIMVTELRIDGGVVMIDDPMHWIGMKKLAEACAGKVLIGGLGLGLILYHLKNNSSVTKIDVVEINEDVIELISPFLPEDNRVTIHNDDIFAYEWVHGDFDTIVLDIWVKREEESLEIAGIGEGAGIFVTQLRFQINNPKSKVFIWGHRDPKINPSVEPVSEEYQEMVRGMRK